MNRIKRWAVCMMCFSLLFSLFGCGKPAVTDGPDMVGKPAWSSFTVSGADYQFEVTSNAFHDCFVTGVITDENGLYNEQAEPMPIEAEDLSALLKLELAALPDTSSASPIRLTYTDGVTTYKNVGEDTLKSIYNILSQYITK